MSTKEVKEHLLGLRDEFDTDGPSEGWATKKYAVEVSLKIYRIMVEYPDSSDSSLTAEDHENLREAESINAEIDSLLNDKKDGGKGAQLLAKIRLPSNS